MARLGLKTPADFSRASFMEACVAAHQAANVTLQEGVVFLEKHRRTDTAGQRLPHLNAIDFHAKVAAAQAKWQWRGTAAASSRAREAALGSKSGQFWTKAAEGRSYHYALNTVKLLPMLDLLVECQRVPAKSTWSHYLQQFRGQDSLTRGLVKLQK